MAELPEIIVYTRPGCPFSAMLLAGLRAAELPFELIDIWRDQDAAAAVRAAADGNETVPTVNIGTTWLVNPSVDEVRAARAEAA
jgi:mycoredoxin